MTIKEAIMRAPALQIHLGQVFFNTRDPELRNEWGRLGARIRPFYDDDEMSAGERRDPPLQQGWEIHLLGACDREFIEDATGERMDVTKDALLNAARERIST